MGVPHQTTIRPASRSSLRLLLVAACEQHNGTIALASQNATPSAILALFADSSDRLTDGHRRAPCSPEGRRERPSCLSHETGSDKLRILSDVVRGQRYDLGDRSLAIANDDLFAGSDLSQVLREPVSEFGDVRASHDLSWPL